MVHFVCVCVRVRCAPLETDCCTDAQARSTLGQQNQSLPITSNWKRRKTLSIIHLQATRVCPAVPPRSFSLLKLISVVSRPDETFSRRRALFNVSSPAEMAAIISATEAKQFHNWLYGREHTHIQGTPLHATALQQISKCRKMTENKFTCIHVQLHVMMSLFSVACIHWQPLPTQLKTFDSVRLVWRSVFQVSAQPPHLHCKCKAKFTWPGHHDMAADLVTVLQSSQNMKSYSIGRQVKTLIFN